VVEDHEGGSSIFVFLGPCSLISEHFCRMCHGNLCLSEVIPNSCFAALHVNLVQHSMLVILLSFCYRFYILSDIFSSRPPPTRPQIWGLCSLSLLFMAPLTVSAVRISTESGENYANVLICEC
ncbi:hypothetical protein PENTCL1PPCAC_15456, partial [Pristionchus entomophagus]